MDIAIVIATLAAPPRVEVLGARRCLRDRLVVDLVVDRTVLSPSGVPGRDVRVHRVA